jgi:CubicO group peptidase (beta-lactamase class C family)
VSRRRRISLIVLGTVVLLLGAVFGGSHLLTGSSSFARAVAWGESDIDDRFRFPERRIARGDSVSRLPDGPRADLGIDDFLADHATRAFLVVHRDRIVYERYFDGASARSAETSFSMAKSVTSTLVGIAVDRGAIGSIDDPITRYLPELAERDRRFERIRIRDLLTMSSGIRYEEKGMPWSHDALTYYGTDLRDLALTHTEIERPPGERWLYNNFHPLLLGLILERATEQRVSDFAGEHLWQPLGAEADASWSLDSEDSGFEKMESGINARARDFARFGQLFLHEGEWNGRRIVPERWVREVVRPGPSPQYGAMWWLAPQSGSGRQPFFARGKYGQTIAVVPEEDAVVVRLGSDDAGVDWADYALRVARRLP